jgi:superfamily II DNA or RNA helicase
MLKSWAMDLSSVLASSVASQVRQRGEAYLREGRVRIVAQGKDFVSARVSGSSPYDVELARTSDSLVVSCTCPYYERDLDVCKHIWAAVLAAGAKGYLLSRTGKAPRYIAPADYEPWDLDGDDTEIEPEDDRWQPSPAAAYHRPPASSLPPQLRPASRFQPQAPPPPGWRDHVARFAAEPAAALPPIEDLHYFLDPQAARGSGVMVLELRERSRKTNGQWGKFRPLKLLRAQIGSRAAQALDRQILALLAGASQHLGPAPSWHGWQGYSGYQPVPAQCEVPETLAPLLIPLLCASGRVHLRRDPPGAEGPPLAWDDGDPWTLWLEVRRREDGEGYAIAGSLRRGAERMPLEQPAFMLRAGFVFTSDRVARLDHGGAFGWVALLRQEGRLQVPAAEVGELIERIFALPTAPPLDLPEELRCEEVAEAPAPRLLLLEPDAGPSPWQPAAASFRYGAEEVAAGAAGRLVYQPASRRLIQRDRDAEARALERLRELGFQPAAGGRNGSGGHDGTHRIQRRQAGEAVQALLAEGWLIEAEGRRLRAPSRFQLAVSSQVDWFELQGGVEFDGETAPFPELLAALRRGEGTVRLGDGSSGLLPEAWLRRFAPLAAFGQPAGDQLRFRAAQVGLLDALLAMEPSATCDATFAQARQRLQRFAGIEAVEAPSGFSGELRGYQKAGLAWLHFLRDFGFGGCLADDMGLGKTVQVLALLESRRAERRRLGLGPSLAVVPRSLIFNWIAEAARFTPALRVRNHTGGERDRRGESFAGCDLVLTTYGTLRRDAACLRQTEFDYIVLDEAQAIKNPHSESAKAARLLKGSHRLVLTGTPVENHLGDLWSLLEFLNPGMVGASAVLRSAGGLLRDPDAATRAQLSRALRPFILRRTKEQVAAELPRKLEQTIFCELPARQRRLYDELRDHYRAALGARVKEHGLGRAKILVLEALLRLRQAACHPGLLDRDREQEPSAKLEFLVPQVMEVLEEGHKALVFSQFTSFLAILRRDLDRRGVAYAYLDGHTRDRAEQVARFQDDPACKLFLISLKAGGLGLNLTAADYVYLLDPWWNPAVEAQAIDRAHRIGQTRQVFAYRIVAKDTVEEKILALQQSKRELADAIIAADDSLLRRLSREDLELLLS